MPALTGRAGAVAQQGDVESRPARRIGGQRTGRRRRNLPACLCNARTRLGGQPQQERRCARRFGRKRKPACRRQIEALGHAPKFDQDRAQRRAAHRLQRGAQSVLGPPHPHMDDMGRIEPQCREPRHEKRTGLTFRKTLADPDDPACVARDALRKAGAKTGQRRRIGRLRRKHFVQRAARQSAAQRRVGPFRAQRHNASLVRLLLHRRQGRDLTLQFDQGRLHENLQCSLFVPIT